MPKYTKTPKLKKLLTDLNLNQTLVANMAGMSPSSFKNKLSEKHPGYGFTDEEYSKIIGTLMAFADHIYVFTKNHDRKREFTIYTTKK